MAQAPTTSAVQPSVARNFSSTVVGEVLMLDGALNLAAMPDRLAETDAYASQDVLPECLTIDFQKVTEIDSSGVALLLHWRRKAGALGKSLRYVHIPPNLVALAELYGVSEMIHCPNAGVAAAS
jgi:phospholipid transport system transporter-binding protein